MSFIHERPWTLEGCCDAGCGEYAPWTGATLQTSSLNYCLPELHRTGLSNDRPTTGASLCLLREKHDRTSPEERWKQTRPFTRM
jgi:hypothetical protein